jgi:hypothetical protein
MEAQQSITQRHREEREEYIQSTGEEDMRLLIG